MPREKRTSIRIGLEEAKQAEIAIGEAVITARTEDDRRLMKGLERKLNTAVWRLRKDILGAPEASDGAAAE